jgi:hypothetical protein
LEKQFDLDLNWFGTKRPFYLAEFWKTASHEGTLPFSQWPRPTLSKLFNVSLDRLKMARKSRGGGSITPEVMAELRKLEGEGVLSIRPCADVVGGEWLPSGATPDDAQIFGEARTLVC